MTTGQTPWLVRPKQGRMIAGVAAGLADRFGMDRGMMRLLFVLSLILPGPQILIYLVLWVIIPEEGSPGAG
jgi:phage shock protein PspC (stress-responsive transcriptional regulator)